MEVSKLSSVQNQSFTSAVQNETLAGNRSLLNSAAKTDSFELSSNRTNNIEKVGFFRIIFHRLTNEQIKALNEAKELPEGAKFVEAIDSQGFKTGRPVLTWNAFNITPGTQKMPAGYEFKNDILGFTHLVREGTESILYRE